MLTSQANKLAHHIDLFCTHGKDYNKITKKKKKKISEPQIVCSLVEVY